MAQRTYRVTVRGRFDGLDDATRARLLSEAAEHDVLVARFTDDGTLTYDQRLDAFQHRVVVRVDEGRGGGGRRPHGRGAGGRRAPRGRRPRVPPAAIERHVHGRREGAPPLAGAGRPAIRAAATPAPNPLSMLTTRTPGAQAVSMVSSGGQSLEGGPVAHRRRHRDDQPVGESGDHAGQRAVHARRRRPPRRPRPSRQRRPARGAPRPPRRRRPGCCPRRWR